MGNEQTKFGAYRLALCTECVHTFACVLYQVVLPDRTLKRHMTYGNVICRLEEFEAWESQFRSSVEGNTVSGSLELDDLVQHSPLESCYYLGKMLEANYPLSKAKKGWDTSSRFPVLALSMLSQRLLNLEKAKAQKAEARVQELTKRIAQLEAASIR